MRNQLSQFFFTPLNPHPLIFGLDSSIQKAEKIQMPIKSVQNT